MCPAEGIWNSLCSFCSTLKQINKIKFITLKNLQVTMPFILCRRVLKNWKCHQTKCGKIENSDFATCIQKNHLCKMGKTFFVPVSLPPNNHQTLLFMDH